MTRRHGHALTAKRMNRNLVSGHDIAEAIDLPSWVILEFANAVQMDKIGVLRMLEGIRLQDPRVFERLVRNDYIRPSQFSIELRRRFDKVVAACVVVVDISQATTPRQIGDWIRINRNAL